VTIAGVKHLNLLAGARLDINVGLGASLVCSLVCSWESVALAQVAPVNGMREADAGPQAIVGATVIASPTSEPITDGVVLIDRGLIVGVGANLAVPPGYRVWQANGLTLYAGFVEAAFPVDSTDAQNRAAAGKGAHWNRLVVPQVTTADLPPLSKDARESLRALGFAAAQVLPEDGIFRGQGSVVLLDDDERAKSLDPTSCFFIGFEPGSQREEFVSQASRYPSSLMGVIALERQTLLDARWYAGTLSAWESTRTNASPPLDAVALAALAPLARPTGSADRRAPRVLFDAADETTLLRQARIADEFGLAPRAIFLGSGTEFRRTASFAHRTLLIPPRTPRTPDATSVAKTEALSLRDLWTWELAPTNAARLERAGVSFAFTSAKLDDRKAFRDNVRTAIEHGLPASAALAAVTTRPAEILGLAERLGTIETGKIANLVLIDGLAFGDVDHEPGTVRAVWTAGTRHVVDPAPLFPFDGPCRLIVAGGPTFEALLDLKDSSFIVTLNEKADDQQSEKVTIRPFKVEGDRFSCMIDGRVFGRDGSWRAGGVAVGSLVEGRADAADGTTVRFTVVRSDAAAPAKPANDRDDAAIAAKLALADRPLPFPFGEFGLTEVPKRETVLVRNATVWTESDRGIVERCDLLVRDGKIAELGPSLATPEGARVIDANGRHVTPGLIDCHSHTGIDGGVNEGTQSNTAECRIGDVTNAEDVNWYRALAGGLTAANQLHGSSNPIGGQNNVVKLRWGEDEAAFRVAGAIPGIKFALGENVTRNRERYPDSRTGVETFLRDAFDAAHNYDRRKRAGEPIRPDLELEALAEILRGERIIHCHSYRQDEILMLIGLADSLGFRIGTFQHVLEGYKVADAIAKHGAGASSFSDWWAYKMEVMDAIPWNGAILTKLGATTSFNSDSNELARRLNTEAAKAVRYGGLEPHEALKLVTINPAKQLRIDALTGSLEVGKAADFVIWSADPLSIYARADETWVDGARRFSRENDEKRATETRLERERLLARAASARGAEKAKAKKDRDKQDEPPPASASAAPKPLLARMLLSREAWFMELVRRGFDPEEIRPGECGCGSANAIAGGAQ